MYAFPTHATRAGRPSRNRAALHPARAASCVHGNAQFVHFHVRCQLATYVSVHGNSTRNVLFYLASFPEIWRVSVYIKMLWSNHCNCLCLLFWLDRFDICAWRSGWISRWQWKMIPSFAFETYVRLLPITTDNYFSCDGSFIHWQIFI